MHWSQGGANERAPADTLSEVTCEASTVRGEGTELCNETQKGAQFLDVFRSLEVSQRRELFIVGADAAIRDDVSCELYGTAHFELLSGYGYVVVGTSLQNCCDTFFQL